jgi:hypothetical protein
MIYNYKNFPWLVELHKAYEIFKKEAANCNKTVLDIWRPRQVWPTRPEGKKFLEKAKAQNGWVKAWQVDSSLPNDGWLNYGLIFNGEPLDANAEDCPQSVEILRKIGVNVAGFSNLKAGSEIKPHTDANGPKRYNSITYHLGLDVPEGCHLYVGSEKITEKNGVSVVFDAGKPHAAVNTSDTDRIILYADVKFR